jgi:polyisoprenoid-binding protein YceI
MTVRRGGVRTLGPPEVRMAASPILRGLVVLALVSCSPPGTGATPSSEAPVATATPATVATPLPPGAIRFAIVPDRSRATIRVREQVASIPAPGEAVLTTGAFSGDLVLLADGSFAKGSLVAVELDTLRSDNDLRDEWIKINTLQTRRFPRAEFDVARVTDVPLPLPADGEWTARLIGTMRIHGVERELAWELRTTRAAGEMRVRGSTTFHFGDYGMDVPANRLVLSVVDLVSLEIDVVARPV